MLSVFEKFQLFVGLGRCVYDILKAASICCFFNPLTANIPHQIEIMHLLFKSIDWFLRDSNMVVQCMKHVWIIFNPLNVNLTKA